jgi:alpha-glucosidase
MVAEEYGGDRLLIGEIYLPIDRLVTYHGTALDEVHLPFNFGLAILPEWEVEVIARLVAEYEAALPAGAWPNWVLGNHDLARIATRVGPAQARLAAMLLLTLRGTPTIYYGDELGMEDVPIPPALMHDPQAALNPSFSRDPARSPMQWDATPHAGFCPSDVAPWLPVAANYREVNVATQRGDECSILNLHERLLSLRRSSPALTLGDHEPTEAPTECFAYVRVHQDERMLVALNFGESEREVRLPGTSTGLLRLSTRLDRSEEECRDFVRLRRLEGCLVRLDR